MSYKWKYKVFFLLFSWKSFRWAIRGRRTFIIRWRVELCNGTGEGEWKNILWNVLGATRNRMFLYEWRVIDEWEKGAKWTDVFFWMVQHILGRMEFITRELDLRAWFDCLKSFSYIKFTVLRVVLMLIINVRKIVQISEKKNIITVKIDSKWFK